MIDNSIDSTSVDMNGNGYSFPNSRSVTSPGILPMPSLRSHGQHADSTATAMKVVSSQRIIVWASTQSSKRMRAVAARERVERAVDAARKRDHLEQLAHLRF